GEATITATVEGAQATATVKATNTKQPAVPSFRNHVIPMMTKIGCNSGACHGALAGKGGMKLSLRGYAPEVDHFVLTRQTNGRRVDPLDPAHSLMLLKPTMAVSHGGGQKLEPGSSDYQVIADWIAHGAPAPKDDDARIQRLEVFPPEAFLKPKDQLQVIVRAWYSDGHSQDVTHWVKFNSSEDLVATVDPEGKVTVTGHGETAITIWYSNLVATARIVSPLPNKIDPAVFAKAERKNFIDELALKKLASLRIPPSPLCTDAEFIRRAYLDATGTLPTPEEVRKFITGTALDKRAKLIDALLEKPEFVDYWTYKWSDLLLVSTRRLPQSGTWAFYQFVRQSVADNKSWDRFAHDVLTASGNSLQNGGVNYFVLHKDVSDLTEATSLTFMGMSITCCRCHNHPLERWTQDQYWSMANLFSRVAFKNGDRAGDVSVQAQPSGDIPHLRRGVPMPPAPLDHKAMPLDSPADRRAYFADWLTSPENPYFAKALVNRVWRNFLGRGLVEAEDDLRQTNPPTNEELFDALAKDLVAHKHDVKHAIRTIMNSATYQRSAKPLPENVTDDRFYSHYLVKRLSAEVILDAYSQVTGVPTPFNQVVTGVEGGTAAYNGYPPGTRALQLPDSLVASRFLDSFGRPERVQTCSCERQQDSSITQALHLNNGQTLNDKLRDKKCRIETWLKDNVSDEEAIRRVYQLALCREPTETESTNCRASIGDGQTPRREALEDLFWAVLTSKEFLFNR
ncbi:MAG TPA: DUF1549 and DUF1553 domain-containing protein, partial [Gemmataceae bacterium]|nr:DUF1549 and DUF1553 domain-containing protein [Gemmataceae bacterium]